MLSATLAAFISVSAVVAGTTGTTISGVTVPVLGVGTVLVASVSCFRKGLTELSQLFFSGGGGATGAATGSGCFLWKGLTEFSQLFFSGGGGSSGAATGSGCCLWKGLRAPTYSCPRLS